MSFSKRRLGSTTKLIYLNTCINMISPTFFHMYFANFLSSGSNSVAFPCFLVLRICSPSGSLKEKMCMNVTNGKIGNKT